MFKKAQETPTMYHNFLCLVADTLHLLQKIPLRTYSKGDLHCLYMN